MRRPATWLAVGVVLLVGVAAAADAVRQKASKPGAASTTTEPEGTTTQASAATGLSGVLFYTNEQCRLVGRRLPDLNSVQAPTWSECLFSLSPDGRDVAPGAAIWHPGGTVVAGQSGSDIQVFAQEGSTLSSYAFNASAPSFSLQARLTFALGTEIRVMDAGCPLLMSDERVVPSRAIRRCSTVDVSAEAVERAALRHPSFDRATGFLSVSIRETVWLGAQQGPTRLAALLRLRTRTAEEFDLIGLFERGAIAETIALFETVSGLRASPGGSYFGVLSRGPSGLLVFDRDGRQVTIPEAPSVNAFDWSPDEAWMAVSTSTDVLVFVMEGPRPPVRGLGLVARDLAWR